MSVDGGVALRTVRALRYVAPLREGGSLPAIVEGDDDGTYVLKFRGAGQGQRALIAELVAGELARALALPVPEIVLMDLDPVLARSEPDGEIRDLVQASGGLNLAMDYLPGSYGFDPAAGTSIDQHLASRIVWFDAYITNVDRTARNPNLLYWHRDLYLIDHGAALYMHHDWAGYLERASTPFTAIRQHVLLPYASQIVPAAMAMIDTLTPAVIHDVVSAIPEQWLGDEPRFATVTEHRLAYSDYLLRRLESAAVFTEEAIQARAALL